VTAGKKPNHGSKISHEKMFSGKIAHKNAFEELWRLPNQKWLSTRERMEQVRPAGTVGQ